MLFFSASCPAVPMTSSISRAEFHRLGIELELAGLDLRKIEYLVDEAKQVGAGGVHTAQRFLRLFGAETRRVHDQHLGQADNRVERRSQLVAHAGEEIRLVLARLRQLAALVLDLAEQPRVLDRQDGLRREGLQQFDRAFGKFAGRLAAYDQRPHHLAGAHERHQQPRPIAGA